MLIFRPRYVVDVSYVDFAHLDANSFDIVSVMKDIRQF
jgi:hypothetical protein